MYSPIVKVILAMVAFACAALAAPANQPAQNPVYQVSEQDYYKYYQNYVYPRSAQYAGYAPVPSTYYPQSQNHPSEYYQQAASANSQVYARAPQSVVQKNAIRRPGANTVYINGRPHHRW